jgi:two-component system response regulator YesN
LEARFSRKSQGTKAEEKGMMGMGSSKGVRFSKYFLRIVLFNLFAATVPIIILGVFSYNMASGKIQQKVNEGNRQILEQTQMRMEQTLKLMDSSLTQFINSPLVHTALQQSLLPDQFAVIGELSQSLNKLQPFELGIQNIRLINYEKQWVLDNKGLQRLDGDTPKSELDSYLAVPYTSFWRTDSSQVMLVKKLPIHAPRPIGLLIAEIPFHYINDRLVNHSDEALSQYFILDGQYTVLAHADAGMVGKSLASSSWVKQVINQPELTGYFADRVDDKEMGVSYIRSSYNNWTYVSVTSLQELAKDSRAIGSFTIITCLIVSIFTLLISLQGSRKIIYSPIRKLYDAVRGTSERDNLDPGKDEIELIGEQFSFLHRTQSQMTEQMQLQQQQLQEFFVMKLFRGEVRGYEINEKLEKYGYPLEWKRIVLIIVQIDTLEGTRYREQDYDLLMFAVNNIVGELIPEEQRLQPIVIGQSQATIIGSMKEQREVLISSVYALAEQIQITLGQVLGLKVSVAVSRPLDEWRDTQGAYKEALETLRYLVRTGGASTILMMDDFNPRNQGQYQFPAQPLAELAEAVRSGDKTTALRELKQYISEVLAQNLSQHDFQMAMIRLLVELTRELQNSGYSIQALLEQEHSIFEYILDMKTAEEVEQSFTETILLPTMTILEDRRALRLQLISDKMKQIIEQEYDQDLTLEICAERLNYHPNHLKKVFRKETGVNFSDYVSQFRLNVAKEWLRNTDMKIVEIAERLQYNNSQNFIRYFRKMESMTPGQYREEHSK